MFAAVEFGHQGSADMSHIFSCSFMRRGGGEGVFVEGSYFPPQWPGGKTSTLRAAGSGIDPHPHPQLFLGKSYLWLPLLLLRSQLYLWGSPFLVRFLRMWPFFNPTIELITFCLHGWCMLGVGLLPAFTCLGHKFQDLLSLCDGIHVCTD